MKIAHISDIHVHFGGDFNETMFEKGVRLVNKCEPDVIMITGDITTMGLLKEYECAQEKLKGFTSEYLVIPGNHDERNLGYVLFPEFFGRTSFIKEYGEKVTIIGLATSEPDKDEGRLGRHRHTFIEEGVACKSNVTVIGFHHHVIPVPKSGREHNIIEDAGETLDILLRHEVPLVLMGHRHVQYGVKIHQTLLVNAGTFSSTRTRGHFGNTFNLIDVDGTQIMVSVVDIEKEKIAPMIVFDPATGCYRNRYYDVHAEIR